MRILIGLTYYRPHYSGLTIYTERLAHALAERGHQVTVLTSRFSPDLPAYEKQNGVEVIRLDVKLRISKGVIMPSMPAAAWKAVQRADVINLHIPQLDAALIAVMGRIFQKPVVLTYHCDLHLPQGPIHAIANRVSFLANIISAANAKRIVTNTLDYAEHSGFLKTFLRKVVIIPPPIVLPPVGEEEIAGFKARFNVRPGDCIIGMAARLATEKGVEYLVQAMPRVLERFPNARVFFVGQHERVMGEEAYAQRLAPLIQQLGEHWTFLGILEPKDLACFFHSCAVTVLPSINGTESFGMVQVESMICGTPVVASDLPGIRQPVLSTQIGKIVPPRESSALADALIELLEQPGIYREKAKEIAFKYSPATVAHQYEQIFQELLAA